MLCLEARMGTKTVLRGFWREKERGKGEIPTKSSVGMAANFLLV